MQNKVKIKHNLQDIRQGEDIILTLKQSNLLDQDEINHKIDQLENIEIKNQEQANFARDMNQNLHKYASVNEAHLTYKLGQKTDKVLLPHYQQRKAQKEGFLLDPNGQIQEQVRGDVNNWNGVGQKVELGYKKVMAEQYQKKKVIKMRKSSNKRKAKQIINFLQNQQDNEQQGQYESQTTASKKLIQDKFAKAQQNFKIKLNSSRMQLENQEEQLNRAIAKHRREVNKEPVRQAKELLLQLNEDKKEQDEKILDWKIYGKKRQQVFKDNISLKNVKDGSESIVNIPLPSQRICQKPDEQLHQKTIDNMKQELEFMYDRPLGQGLAETLKYLKQKGKLKDQEEFVGRNKDKRIDKILEYRNANGQLMTQKEAFRYMCWKFHGRGPGKNKIQKKKRNQAIKQKLKTQGTQTTLMKVLKEHQNKTEQPYIEIKGVKK